MTPKPTPQHPEIVSYPAIVYQKSPLPPGYVAVPVATEEELLALTGGPVFLTAENAIRYQPPPEQPFPDIARTDNFDQFDPRKSVMGVPTEAPVTREVAPNVYVRTGPPDPPAPPPDPPATQGAAAQQPAASSSSSSSSSSSL